MKKILMAAVFAVMAASAVTAEDLKIDFNGRTSKSLAAPEASAPILADALKANSKASPKEWTVMVFINGKNNLEIAGLYNVNQMEKIGSTRDMNIVVEIGRMKGQAAGDTDLDGDWTGSRRLLIKKDKNPNKITSPVVQEDKVVDMGDYKRAVDFVKWSKEKYPAKRYMLVIWNHGSGWMDPRKEQKGISFDDETGNYIRTPQIGLILKEAGKVDIMAFDACLMNMVEVAYEVKDDAQVIVGSEETVPGLGYPYDLFLGAMAKKPALSTEEVGAVMVEAFKMFYDAVKKGAQLSALRASKLDGLGVKMSEFAKLAQETGDLDAMKAARNGVIRYDAVGAGSDPDMKISFYGDVSQFAQLVAANLKEHAKAAELKASAAALQEYIDKELVIDNKASGMTRSGRDLAESKGVSVYLPPVETRIAQERLEGIFEGKYSDFAFDKATGWHGFVTFLYTAK
ncbi:MAG: clostripain-related cysteine peptidase [Elusimicrobiota bacterium]|nr:clostripain-related cysteine peptidase [Elusimicrobiota bacterium]